MARLYGDENFALGVVLELRRLGHDVLTIQEDGYGGQRVPDERVLTLASQAGRAVLTFNRRHFIRLHADRPHHKGLIVCTFDADFLNLAARIHVAVMAVDQLAGQLLRVNRPER